MRYLFSFWCFKFVNSYATRFNSTNFAGASRDLLLPMLILLNHLSLTTFPFSVFTFF